MVCSMRSNSTMPPVFPGPPFGVGKVVRLNRAGDIEDVATGLSVPTGMTFGPDGYLYVSNFGATPTGQILRHLRPLADSIQGSIPSIVRVQMLVF